MNNRGDAFFETESTYNYKPSISSISPSSGSFNGGTKVTISGAGFVGRIAMDILRVKKLCPKVVCNRLFEKQRKVDENQS